MIHVHVVPNMTALGRETHLQPWVEGVRVRDVIPQGWRGHTLLNNAPCGLDDPVADNDHVHAVSAPQDPVSIAYSVLISLAISEAIKLLLPEPAPPVERGDDRSPTHGFSRMKNVRVEGQPIPRGYGIHRVPGTIINEFIEVNNATGESTYFALVCLGHGPVKSIADSEVDTPALTPLTSKGDTISAKAFVNDNPVSNFAGVEMWIRRGTAEQDTIPGFERAKTSNTIDVELGTEPVGAGVPLISDYNSDADDDHWEDHGFAWDSTVADIDGVEVVINFPSGLYRVDQDGNILTSPFVLGIRFCKLDGNGNAVLGPGNGGNQDDGWVRLPFEEFDLDRQDPFQLGFPVWLYDPADHIDPVPGDALHTGTWTSGQDGWRTTALVGNTKVPDNWKPGVYGTGAIVDEVMFECWVAFDATSAQGPFSFTGDDRYICLWEWSSDGTKNGLWFGFRVTAAGEWFPHFAVGKWSRTEEWSPVTINPTTDAADKKWHHIVFGHRRINSEVNLSRVFVDGVFYGDKTQSIDIIRPSGLDQGDATWKFGFSVEIYTASRNPVKGWWDEVQVKAIWPSFASVQDRYNGGVGQLASGANPDVVGLYHFDGSTFLDAGPFSNDCQDIGGQTSFLADGGIVTVFEAPGRTRGKYRVQVVRVNGESTGAGDDRRQDTAEWQLAVSWIDEAFCYPGAAYWGVVVPATEQLNTSAPDLTAVAELAEVRVWDGVSAVAPTFYRKWTRNTAWIAVDVATDPDFGGGSAFKIENVDMVSAQAFADVCDERVYDGRGRRDFYRQEFEASTNRVTQPETFNGAFWNAGNATVTANVATAPDGNISADRITDGSGPLARLLATTAMTTGSEPTWFRFQIAIKKDAAYTGASPCISFGATGYDPIEASFNVDTGEAIAGCSVVEHPDDSDWWLVRLQPWWHEGGNRTLNLSIYPARYDYGTTNETVLLEGSITVWGAMSHRGLADLNYPEDSAKPRAWVYMGNLDDDGVAQVIPEHWLPGYELRLRNCATADWDTPVGQIAALTIIEIEQLEEFDGYTRAWRILVEWYSDTVGARPSGQFANLLQDSRDWEDIGTHWVPSISGITQTKVFDDAGVAGGGPPSTSPLLSDVLEIDQGSHTIANTEQAMLATPNTTLRVRALMAKEGGTLTLSIEDTQSSQASVSAEDVWEAVTVDHQIVTSTPEVRISWAAAIGFKLYADAVACWTHVDVDGNTAGGQVEGAEALHTYDGQHDTFKGFWRTLVDICLTARCIPVREGNRLRFKPDTDRQPVGLVTMASTVMEDGGESTFRVRYQSRKVRANSYTLDFNDERKNWERAVALVESPDLEGTAAAGLVRPEQFFIKGLTRRSAVIRHGKYLIAQNETLVHEVSFQTGPGAVFFEPGDILEIAHDVLPWGQSGRCRRDSSVGVNLIPSAWDDFSEWTPSVSGQVQVTTNVRALPNGMPTADLIESLATAQTVMEKVIPGESLEDGETYVFSVHVRAKVTPESATGLLISQAGSGTQTVLAELSWVTKAMSEVTATGNALNVDALGDGYYRIACEFDVNGGGDVTLGFIPARGTTILGKSVYVGDAQFEKATAEPTAMDYPGVGIHLDRTVELKVGEDYTARVTNLGTGESKTCEVYSAAGEYLPGDMISVDTVALGFNPQEGDEYIIYTDAERFQMQVVEMGLNESGVVDVEGVEYDGGVFNGDDLSENEVEESFSTNNDGSEDGAGGRDVLLPGEVWGVTASEMTVHSPGGATELRLDVAWSPDPDTARAVREYHVFIAYLSDETNHFGALRQVATVAGGTSSAIVRLPNGKTGQTVRVAVQPVSWGGMRMKPEHCAGDVVTLAARAPKPDPPTSFDASMEGDQITYTWDAPANADGLVYELRHGTITGENAQGDLMGGWVLAQKIGETRDTFFGPTSWWATCNSLSGAPDNVEYILRARNVHGVYSDAVVLAFGARVLNSQLLNATTWWMTYGTQAWHEYADGWVTDSAAPTYDPNLSSSLQRHADGYIEFASGLSGTYRTADLPAGDTPAFFEREQPIRIEAAVFAIARNPTEVGEGRDNGDGTFNRAIARVTDQVGWEFAGNVTAEGHLQGELPTIKVQMRLIRDGSAGAPLVLQDQSAQGNDSWIDYKPGVYQCHGAQFRLTVTRPSTGWDVRIHQFYVQAQRDLSARHYRNPHERVIARELGIG